MCPVVVVVADILLHQSAEMAFVQHDDMIEQVAATVPNPALSEAVLPRTLEARSLRLDVQGLDRAHNFMVEVRGPVKNQVARRRVIGECFAQLLFDAARATSNTL